LRKKKGIPSKSLMIKLRIPLSPEHARGLIAEEVITKALESLTEEETIINNLKVIGFRRTLPLSPEDLEGIDILVRLRRDEKEVKMPINVKDYWNIKKVREYRKKGIWTVTVWFQDREKEPYSPVQIEEEAKKALTKAIKDFSRLIDKVEESLKILREPAT
jgi:hypothetical protein